MEGIDFYGRLQMLEILCDAFCVPVKVYELCKKEWDCQLLPLPLKPSNFAYLI